MEGRSAEEAQAEYYIKAEHGEEGLDFYRKRKKQPFSEALADARALRAYRAIARHARKRGAQADLWELDEARLIEIAKRLESED